MEKDLLNVINIKFVHVSCINTIILNMSIYQSILSRDIAGPIRRRICLQFQPIRKHLRRCCNVVCFCVYFSVFVTLNLFSLMSLCNTSHARCRVSS